MTIQKTIYGDEYRVRRHLKISDEQVREIRESERTDRELAKKYGVCNTTINHIRNFKMRKGVK